VLCAFLACFAVKGFRTSSEASNQSLINFDSMKILSPGIIRLLPLAFFLLLPGCKSADSNEILEDLQENLEFGNTSFVIHIGDSLNKIKGEDKEILHISDSLAQIAERINLDFSLTEDQINAKLEKMNGSFTPAEKAAWEKKGWLEFRMINGEKRYFNRAASNLVLLRKFREKYDTKSTSDLNDPEFAFRMDHTKKVLLASGKNNDPVVPVKMEITYTLTVKPDAVPDGEKIRCWLPFPKSGCVRQKNIQLLSTSNPEYLISPDSSTHSTLYMESQAVKGNPAIFQVKYSYVSSAMHFNPSVSKILAYNKSSYDYQRYTAEQLPNICFTDNLKTLTDSITRPDEDPATTVRKIYMWFKENIPWTGALEYSIIPNIPEYVMQNMRGDCGMQTFLLISMLRYKGIPARWQSGWMMAPGYQNLHDWCEVYYEGIGWVPVDVTYDLQNSEEETVRNFFLSGIDSYRLIINNGISGPLHPEKTFLRSEPYDFQRGEVEWKGGNLYFDKWDYEMQITYPE
jgi:transglutaminase-like putative cysteine protease